jgi:membrane-associated protease RseP (regulator of RpoE activity)
VSIFDMSDLLSFGVLVAFIVLIYILDGSNFKREGGLLFLRRIESAVEWIHKVGVKFKSFFKGFSTIGIVFLFGYSGLFYYFKTNKITKFRKYVSFTIYSIICLVICVFSYSMMNIFVFVCFVVLIFGFGVVGITFLMLLYNSYSIIFGSVSESAVQLVLPVSIPDNYNLPVVSVPFIIWLIAILFIVVIHELFHAFSSSSVGHKVKSVGYGFFFILPIGFAEPDEDKLKEMKSYDRSRIFAAGPFSNIVSGFMILAFALLFVFSFNSFVKVDQMYDYSLGYSVIENNSMLPSSVLPDKGYIEYVNGVRLNNISDFLEQIEKVNPKDQLSLGINGTNYEIILLTNPENESKGYIGITEFYNNYELKNEYKNTFLGFMVKFYDMFLELFNWLFVLSIGIAIVNVLPIRALDGGRIFDEIINTFNCSSNIMSFLTKSTIVLLLFNIFGPYLIKLIVYLL